MAKIACVIVTYNRKQLLEEALNSVLIQAEAPEYVFVIDNASTDGTEKYINDKFNFDNRHWHYVRCSQNLGDRLGLLKVCGSPCRQIVVGFQSLMMMLCLSQDTLLHYEKELISILNKVFFRFSVIA